MKTGDSLRERIRELMREKNMTPYRLIQRSGAPASPVRGRGSGEVSVCGEGKVPGGRGVGTAGA